MNIVILTNLTFPVGLAGANRIIAYCKGLMLNGVDVSVISTVPNSHNFFKGAASDIPWDNIDYYTPPISGLSQWRLVRVFLRKCCKLWAIGKLLVMLIRTKPDAVIFYGTHIAMEFITTVLCSLYNTISLKEESEHPGVLVPSHFLIASKWVKRFYTEIRYRWYSGILSMTQPLQKYFEDIGIPEEKIQVIPHTVLQKRFTDLAVNPHISSRKYIAYTGGFKESKDGVLSLVKAFDIVNNVFADIDLLIIGTGTPEQSNLLSDTIRKCAATQYIKVIGEIPNYNIPMFTSNACLLVSCRPESVQADYGFPTKIVEYLATGKPIVTTSYGDMKSLLVDRVNAFIAESSDPAIFARKMLEALANIAFANEVGKHGGVLAKEAFDPQTNTRLIIRHVFKLRMLKKGTNLHG